jgi:hypothetical protein
MECAIFWNDGHGYFFGQDVSTPKAFELLPLLLKSDHHDQFDIKAYGR